ncbi:FAS1 domain-containing protein [Basidiobolus meristosporus CBS 931.73]|uniref:FAS1 domain-containing protein n=1 Tax=Basidiobolus meristosporus CBS 931.73 TaxID=1314790 RepID=A0A1Y1X8Y7_9FUNG|nr:FAS1 domain-containing protein [Basidiobolus meristosporus CBS 931.73]|eukprot:ORX81814.1 FAS1 domain-containing protein [Basidiobolus meristosporus CBS 931.73]
MAKRIALLHGIRWLLLNSYLVLGQNTSNSLYQNILSNPNLKIFSSIISQPGFSDFKDILTGPSPYTIFAPIDSALQGIAFDKIEANTAASVFKYHLSRDIKKFDEIVTSEVISTLLEDPRFVHLPVAQPQNLELRVIKKPIRQYQVGFGILSANVTASDLPASNGLLNLVDNVFTPPTYPSQTLTALNLTDFLSFTKSQKLATPIDQLVGLTYFVPENSAWKFSNLTSQGPDSAKSEVDLIRYHVITPSLIFTQQMSDQDQYISGSGGNLTIRIRDGRIFVNNAIIKKGNILLSNGVLHVIDRVLNPKLTHPSVRSVATTEHKAAHPSIYFLLLAAMWHLVGI